jgi:pimeloyl-ACP methyl ester carboxylesterase
MIRSIFRWTTLAASAAVVAVAPGCASAPAPSGNIVLVHGAWMGAAAWDKTAAELRSRGFKVVAVELPGHGKDDTPPEKLSLAGYVDAVIAALPADGKAVLVGHSMAGMVISGVAEKVPARLSKLVYVAAYLPRNGESLYQLSSADADSLVGKYWSQDNPQMYTPATIRKEGIVDVFGADTNAADQQFLIATHRAEAIPPLSTPVQLTAANFGSVPRVYIHTTQDRAVSYALQKTMLANAGGADKIVEIRSSHVPMLSQPKVLADLIAEAAR